MPITRALAAKLKAAARGRATVIADKQQRVGRPWNKNPSQLAYEILTAVGKSALIANEMGSPTSR
jgi:hypothetical protein